MWILKINIIIWWENSKFSHIIPFLTHVVGKIETIHPPPPNSPQNGTERCIKLTSKE
jgi:hypothetical protein